MNKEEIEQKIGFEHLAGWFRLGANPRELLCDVGFAPSRVRI